MRKTIYLRDEDAEVFEEAEALLGEESFSSMLADAVKGWVEARKGQFEEHSLQPWEGDEGGTARGRPVRFVGRRVYSAGGDEWAFVVYETRGGKIVVYATWLDINASSPQHDVGYAQVGVYDSIDDVPRRNSKGKFVGGKADEPREHWVDEDMWAEAKRSLEGPAYDWID